MARKQLVVNADDFGFTPDVNEGILAAHRDGILTAATLMANADAFEDAVRLAKLHPSLDVGCHLVLVGGRSLLPPWRMLPRSLSHLLIAISFRQIRIYEELAAQVRRTLSAGITPTHLDTHKHTHLVPAVLEAVVRLAKEFGIGWVRRPFDFPITASKGTVPALRRIAGHGLRLVQTRFQRVLERDKCRSTDHFAGFQITGRFGPGELVELIRILPEGSTELMCHPGLCREPLLKARTRLKQSRERELRALTAPETKQAIAQCGVEVVNYRQLA